MSAERLVALGNIPLEVIVNMIGQLAHPKYTLIT
jgi:hypothetical protein